MTLEPMLRILHILAGVGWLGEVLVVNFVLSPALRRSEGRDRADLFANMFPSIFHLATALGGIAVFTGLPLLYLHSAFLPDVLFGTAWGVTMTVALSLLVGLYSFHLVLEQKFLRLARRLRYGRSREGELDALTGHLTVIPAVGALVLGTGTLLMIWAAHYL